MRHLFMQRDETRLGSWLRGMLASALFTVACSPGSGQAATITVNSVADVLANDGGCTLREAVIAANTNTASGISAGECAAGEAGLQDEIVFLDLGVGPQRCIS